MSLVASTVVWFGSKASGARRLVLLAIADAANDDGEAELARGMIAAKCKLSSLRTVDHHVLRLVDAEELEVMHRPGRRSVLRVRYENLRPDPKFLQKYRLLRMVFGEPEPLRNIAGVDKCAPVRRIAGAPLRNLAPHPCEGLQGTPAKDCTRDLSTSRTREGVPEKTDPPPAISAEFVPGSLPALKAELREVFPTAPDEWTERDLGRLGSAQAVLATCTAEDWQALRAWFVEADDRARGRQLWPRGRAEFLENASESVEKVRTWWKARGRRWWAARGKVMPAREEEPSEDFRGFWQEHGDGRDLAEAWKCPAAAREFNQVDDRSTEREVKMGFLVRLRAWRGLPVTEVPMADWKRGTELLESIRAKMDSRVCDTELLALLAIAELPKGRRFEESETADGDAEIDAGLHAAPAEGARGGGDDGRECPRTRRDAHADR